MLRKVALFCSEEREEHIWVGGVLSEPLQEAAEEEEQPLCYYKWQQGQEKRELGFDRIVEAVSAEEYTECEVYRD